ncbi:MAG: PQQ-binding-like beta-propeller repeat protein [Solirubrobacteraceae bacterium]
MLDHQTARRIRQGAYATCALICALAAFVPAGADAQAPPSADSPTLGGDAAHRNAWAHTGLRPPLELAWRSDASPLFAAIAVGPRVILQTATALSAVSTSDGTPLWTVPLAVAPAEIATEGGGVYVTNADGVAALNIENGAVVWFAPDAGSTGPVLDAGRLFTGNAAGELVARQASSGNELWRTPVSITGARPAVAGPRVYATGTCRGASVEVTLGVEQWTAGCASAPATRTVLTGDTVISEDGAMYAAGDGAVLVGGGGPGTVGAGVLFQNPLGKNVGALRALDAGSFAPRWTWTPPLAGTLQLRPSVVESQVYQLVDTGDQGLLLGALDAATGAEQWTGFLPGDGSFTPATTSAVAVSGAGLLLVPTAGGGLVALRNATPGPLGLRAALPRNVVPVGDETTITGHLVPDGHGLVGPRAVFLQADPHPFDKKYKTLDGALARRDGFSFTAAVERNTQFRLVADGVVYPPALMYAQPRIRVKYKDTKVDLVVRATLRIGAEPGFRRAGRVGLYRLKEGADTATRIGRGRSRKNGVARFGVRIPADLSESDRVLPCLRGGSKRGFGPPNVLDRFCGDRTITVPAQSSSAAGLSLRTPTGSAMPLKRFMPASVNS